MCIVIDSNVWSCVFQEKSSQHVNFKPVLEWIKSPKGGCIVYGGSKYKQELGKANKYHRIFVEFKNMRKIKEIDCQLVDQDEGIVRNTINNSQCNDAHLIAIFRVSECRLLCSDDRRSFIFIKNRKWYKKHQKPPSIYRNQNHSHLLCLTNIVRLRNVI